MRAGKARKGENRGTCQWPSSGFFENYVTYVRKYSFLAWSTVGVGASELSTTGGQLFILEGRRAGKYRYKYVNV